MNDIQRIETVSGGQNAQTVNGDMVAGDKIVQAPTPSKQLKYYTKFNQLHMLTSILLLLIIPITQLTNAQVNIFILFSYILLFALVIITFINKLTKNILLYDNASFIMIGDSKFEKNLWNITTKGPRCVMINSKLNKDDKMFLYFFNNNSKQVFITNFKNNERYTKN